MKVWQRQARMPSSGLGAGGGGRAPKLNYMPDSVGQVDFRIDCLVMWPLSRLSYASYR